MFPCDHPGCTVTVSRERDLKRHKDQIHGGVRLACDQCNKTYKRKNYLDQHKRNKHREADIPPNAAEIPLKRARAGPDWIVIQKKRAFKNAIISYRIEGGGRDPLTYLQGLVEDVIAELEHTFETETGIKLALSLHVLFSNDKGDKTKNPYFWSGQIPITRGDLLSDKFQTCFPKILNSIEEFMAEQSGWVIDHIVDSELHIARYGPLRGSSYVPLPRCIQVKRAVLNIQNQDQKCFLWCLIASQVHFQDLANPERVRNYLQNEADFVMHGIRTPVELSQIPRFERLNNVSVNVYGFEDVLYPLYISTAPGRHIDLLLYEGHYSLVRNLDRLLSGQKGGHRRKFFCHQCLFPYYEQERLDEHIPRCGSDSRIRMASKPHIKFENLHKQQKQTVVVYCDIECVLRPIAPPAQATATERYQLHEPCAYGLIEAISCCGEAIFQDYEFYRGPNPIRALLTKLQTIALAHQERINNPVPLAMTEDDEVRHQGDRCHICADQIVDPGDKVRDHCHICGRYRGPAHNQCNQTFRLNRDIVVVFHNLRRYDGHLLMQHLGGICQLFGLEVSCIAKSMEDYLTFRLHSPADIEEQSASYNIRFIDSVQFLNSSLDDLVRAMPEDAFKAMSREFIDISLLLRKGVYPYDYMDSIDRFEETELPTKQDFHSRLNNTDISDDDYAHAQMLWDYFGASNLGEFHDKYLKMDVCQLADVVERFRGVCMTHYELDPMHYITLPSFAWDACLKITGIRLETIQDPDMYTFLESGIRGGISVISHRHAKANNPEFPDYSPDDPTSYIVYLDANNLYGWAMNQALPTHGFRWVTDLDIDWKNTQDGYILEVDLEYPEILHEPHNDYPLAPEKCFPGELSPYCQELRQELGLKNAEMKKLIPNLRSKEKYIVHIRNLQLYLQLGMTIGHVHRALAFQQSTWMEPYIMLNTRLRQQAVLKFDKDRFKLMNNAVFGKTMENTRAYKHVKLATSQQQVGRLISNPRFKRSAIFTPELVGVAMGKVTVKLDKAIYVGFTVLELSKTLMYEFHYRHIKPKYGDDVRLLFTDTDSFVYHIQTPDVYAHMAQNIDLYDTSDYPTDHFLYSPTNKKVIGKMSDEMNGEPIFEFVGLRPKMYSFTTRTGDKKRVKGIKKNTVKQNMTFNQYKTALFQRRQYTHDMNLMRSELHQIYSVKLTKTSLSPFDDKRFIREDGISTYAYGHSAINVN